MLPENNGKDPITFVWDIAKFSNDGTFSKTLLDVLVRAFKENGNVQNSLYLRLPTETEDERVDYSIFDDLIEGKNIGFKKFGANSGWGVHQKDFQLSYTENGEKQYVTVLNSLNFHQGSSGYQTNSFLIIKENKTVANNVYIDFGTFMSQGAITEKDRV